MAYIREFTSFRSNIVRLKNYVNKNYQSDKDNELYLIMFNSTINNYPNKNWSSIENDFFEKIPKDDIIVAHHYSYDLPLAQKKRDK